MIHMLPALPTTLPTVCRTQADHRQHLADSLAGPDRMVLIAWHLDSALDRTPDSVIHFRGACGKSPASGRVCGAWGRGT